MVYIPFASLLGLQAALDSFFEPKQPVQDIASITAVDFISPTLGGGSLLDHDSGSGLGEPLNVSLSLPLPPPLRDELSNHATKSIKWKIQKPGYHFGTQFRVGPRGRRLSALRERSRLVSITVRFIVVIIVPPHPLFPSPPRALTRTPLRPSIKRYRVPRCTPRGAANSKFGRRSRLGQSDHRAAKRLWE
jgi:hypothetical protein